MRAKMSPLNPCRNDVKTTRNRYGYVLNDAKKRVFGVIEKVDCSEEIQQYLDTCDFSLIMQQLNPSVVDFSQFDDVFELGDSIRSLDDVLIAGDMLRERFEILPLEVKKQYGSDFDEFARDLVGGGFARLLSEKYQFNKGAQSVADGVDSDGVGVQGSAADGGDAFKRLQEDFNKLREKVEQSGGETK